MPGKEVVVADMNLTSRSLHLFFSLTGSHLLYVIFLPTTLYCFIITLFNYGLHRHHHHAHISITKLATLFVKTLAKPLSKSVKHQFSRFDVTKRLLIGIGQSYHRITSRLTIWASGYRVRSITPLEEEKALQDGAEFIGEVFVFSVSGTLIVLEYNRSSNAEKSRQEQKRLALQAENASLQAKLRALDVRLKAVEKTVQAQGDTLLGISMSGGKGKYVAPPPQQLVPIVDDEEDEEIEDFALGASTSEAKPWWKIW